MEHAGGTSFFINDDSHLWFMLSDPALDDLQVVYANLTTYRHDSRPSVFNDPSCVIYPGEHPFVVHDTCVCYWGAQVCSYANFERHVENGSFRINGDPATPVLLKKMRKCAGDSIYMELGVFQILEDQEIA